MTAATDSTNVSVQRRRKIDALEEFQKMCDNTEGLFIASYTGLDVTQLTALRRSVREAGGQIKVLKNSVAKRVISERPQLAPLAERLRGQLLYGVGPSAPAVAKALCDFAKEQEAMEVQGGAFAGSVLEPEQCLHLANLPSRDALLARLAGTLNAPLTKLASILQELPASLARALAAVARNAEDAESAKQSSS